MLPVTQHAGRLYKDGKIQLKNLTNTAEVEKLADTLQADIGLVKVVDIRGVPGAFYCQVQAMAADDADDVIVLYKHHHSCLDNLFHRCVAKKLLDLTTKPVVVLPADA